MAPYLVDVPVLVFVWSRPEVQQKTFESIRKARPSVLFLASDGGRNEKEWADIHKSRKIVENIDWECQVYKIYMEENQGLYAMSELAFRYVFDRVDRVVLQEDDILADVSFYSYCAELLERYKDDQRILSISGVNWMGVHKEIQSDYFFANVACLWGCALWKRSYKNFRKREWLKDPYVIKQLQTKMTKTRFVKQIVPEVQKTGKYDGHPVGPEFYLTAEHVLQNQLTVCPKYNLCRNIGATDDATHNVAFKKLDRWTQRIFTMPIYTCPLPLKHADCVVLDSDYGKVYEKMFGTQWTKKFRRLITLCKRIWYGDGKVLCKKFVEQYIYRKEYTEK